MLKCLHVVCQPCLLELVDRNERDGRSIDLFTCPICRTTMHPAEILSICSADTFVQFRPVKYIASSKLECLLKHLREMHAQPEIKCVVFSQWATMLDFVEVGLREHGMAFVRLDGSLSQRKREIVLEEFGRLDGPRVLIATLRSTGVGLNLTVASEVYILDPWWNSSVEDQAIDRVHRLGQTRPVKVTRFIMKDSVEERMLEIQSRKSKLIGALTGDQTRVAALDDLLHLFD